MSMENSSSTVNTRARIAQLV